MSWPGFTHYRIIAVSKLNDELKAHHISFKHYRIIAVSKFWVRHLYLRIVLHIIEL